MLILSKLEIQNLFSMQEAIQASKEALALYSAKKSTVPLRLNLELLKYHGQSLFMPAYIEELAIAGVKIVSVFPENVKKKLPAIHASMLLINAKTGETCAMLDGTYLTQLRTGALQGAATDILARKNSKVAVLFGTGGQAVAQVEALLTVRDLDELRVCGRDFDRTKKFVSIIQEKFKHYKTRIIAVGNSEAAIKDADIITTITNSTTPVFDGQQVTPGTHINGLGSYTPAMQELPEVAIQTANKIYFDTEEGVISEAGDFLIPMNKGLINAENVGSELGDVILNKRKGRETELEITLFKSVGSAVFDLVTAYRIYQKALEKKYPA